jgi:RNA polymerase sigma-70 factor (ECF subfamily)
MIMANVAFGSILKAGTPGIVEIEDEQQLFARLKDGDVAAFDRAYARYRTRLYGFLVRLCRSPEVAEDLLQETWLRLAERAAFLRDDTRLGSWLFTVARNLFYSYCRSRLLDEDRIQELGRLHIEKGGGLSPLEAAATHDLTRRVEHALATLRSHYREALLLVAVEGMAPSEAAGVCGLKPEAFRKRLSRAREMLAKQLDRADGSAERIVRNRHD